MRTHASILLASGTSNPTPESGDTTVLTVVGVTLILIFVLFLAFRRSLEAFYSGKHAGSAHETPSHQKPSAQGLLPRRTNLGDLPPAPPRGEPAATPRGAPGQAPQRSESGYKVVEEFSGDSALRGDFVDILGAMGKKLDLVVKAADESRAVIQDLKKENGRLVEENAKLIDLLQNDKHRQLLRNLVKAANFCELSIRSLSENPKAVEALTFVRDECRDRLVDAGLTAYEPSLGTPLADLEGALFETHARTIPTDKADKNNVLAEVHSAGYYYERDGKKIPVAKAELIFYRLSPASNPTPSEQAPQ